MDPDVLDHWKLRKQDIAKGSVSAFDVGLFDKAVAEEEERQLQKSLRREKKRQRREREQQQQEQQRQAVRRLVSKKDRDAIIQKKGVARRVVRDSDVLSDSSTNRSPRNTTPLFEPPSPTKAAGRKRKRTIRDSRSSSPTLSVDDIRNSQYSLFNEPEATTNPSSPNPSPKQSTTWKPPSVPGVKSKKAKEVQSEKDAAASNYNASSAASEGPRKKSNQAISAKNPTQASKPTEKAHRTASNPTSSFTKPMLARATTTPSLVQTLGHTAAARRASDADASSVPKASTNVPSKNNGAVETTVGTSQVSASKVKPSEMPVAPPKVAPKPGPARRKGPIKVLMDPTSKPRQRARVNEYTPKDSAEPQFKNLSTLGRFQKYRVNEPAPDPIALKFIDPATGKTLHATEGASTTRADLRLNTNIARAHEHALDSAKTTATGSTSTPATSGNSEVPRSAQTTEPRFAYPSARPVGPRPVMTCRFWLRGNCNDSLCRWAHEFTGAGIYPPKKSCVCMYWQRGWCQFTDEQCEYQHGYASDNASDVLEDVNGFRRQARRRSDSPDHAGLRQDEVERRSRTSVSTALGRPVAIRSNHIASPVHHMGQHGAKAPLSVTESADTIMPEVDEPYQQPLGAMPTPMDCLAPHTNDAESGTDPDVITARLSVKPNSASGSAHDVDLMFAFDMKTTHRKFLDTLDEHPTFECAEICRDKDFEAYWFDGSQVWASGNILYQQNNALAVYLEDYLVLHCSGSIVRNDNWVMVIYPTQSPSWKYMPMRGAEKSGLRFYVQSTMRGIADPVTSLALTTTEPKRSFISMAEIHLDLSKHVLFTGNNQRQLERQVYMFYPRDTPEAKLVESWVIDAEAKFCYSDELSLWKQFLKEGKAANRVILFHPCRNQYQKIPDFSEVLQTSVPIFQLGVDRSLRSRPDAATRFSCVRLFPTGSVTLITDDVYKYHPDIALRVLETFEQQVKARPEGGRYDRIYSRPGLLAWLATLIDEDSESGKLTEGSPRVGVWKMACNLMNTSAADTSINALRSDKLPPSVLYSPPKRDMPDYIKLWDSSEEDATDFLVEWFSGLCCLEREHYRRFTVLFEPGKLGPQTPGIQESADAKDPREWMSKFRHIKVTTPNRWLAYLAAKAKPRG